MKPLSTTVYTFLVAIKALPKLPPRETLPTASVNSPSDLFESSESVTDRRKALALQALSARLE